jgi:hypothetical protein
MRRWMVTESVLDTLFGLWCHIEKYNQTVKNMRCFLFVCAIFYCMVFVYDSRVMYIQLYGITNKQNHLSIR